MVADRENDRILLLSFSSQLELERVLIDNTSSQGKLSCPEQLCYNDVTSQLYVIHGSECGNPSRDVISLLSECGNPSCDVISLLSERGNPSCDDISLLSERGNPLRLRRVALRSAPVTCATVVAHSLMERLRQLTGALQVFLDHKKTSHPWT